MKRRFITGLCLASLCMAPGCGGDTSKPVQPAGAHVATETLPAPGEITMQDISLYLHDISPTVGGARKPTFWVSAERFTMQEGGQWLFEDARAVIYGETQSDEDITLEAARGTFEEGIGAIMEGGVVANAGTMTLHLENITWKNPEENQRGVAYSDTPLTIDDENLQLRADSVRLYPKEKQFEMTRVAGSIHVGALNQ